MATVFLAALIASHLVLVASEVAMAASQDNNKEANAVEAKIYLYSVDRWKNDGSPVFTKAMADNANKHCNKSFQECCLFQNWTTSSTRFTEKDIITDFSGYPETKRPYMTVKLGMMIPSALSSYTDIACANHSYVVKAAVIRIMEQSRTVFSDKTDHYITSIEENRYPLPPNNLINYIMIPISVALVIICVILLIILMWKCGKSVHESSNPRPVNDSNIEEKLLMKDTSVNNKTTAENGEDQVV